MKKKIVMTVQMNCEKCRAKARKVAAGAEGVDAVAIEGKDKEMVVVVGENVDIISLVKLMRKNVGNTVLLTVADVKPTSKSG
ncbi:heavy metal-associated isoprenylated plant protein 47-like [Aristolochia californica]|uniref:heavy metal-associated isoprenylated plant protein 47-like n=1 Tax=Aristolochia californica TaxID=171875 RepID=UPI0035DAFFC0